MSRTRADAERWVADAAQLLRRALGPIASDAELERPSGLPGWTRKHLVAHVAANADALRNLVTWAKTGVETPMYASPQQRLADIEAGSRMGADELLAWFERSADGLAADWAGLTEADWAAEVVTAQGRTVPLSETPYMRSREAMVHAVDLDAGVGFDDLPEDFLRELGDDIAAKRAGQGPAVEFDGAGWRIGGDGPATRVSGSLPQVVAYLAGRPHTGLADAQGGPAPEIGPWI